MLNVLLSVIPRGTESTRNVNLNRKTEPALLRHQKPAASPCELVMKQLAEIEGVGEKFLGTQLIADPVDMD